MIINESSLRTARLDPRATSLVWRNSGTRPPSNAGLERISRLFATARSIEVLKIEPSARVRDLQFLLSLPRLRRLEVQSNSVETIDGIHHLRSLRQLCLTGEWKTLPSFSPLARSKLQYLYTFHADSSHVHDALRCRSLESLTLLRGRFTDLDGMSHPALKSLVLNQCYRLQRIGTVKLLALDRLDIGICPKLRDISGIKTRALELSSPHPAMLESLDRNQVTKSLQIRAGRLESIDFLLKQPRLKHLEVTAISLARSDISAFKRTRNLKTAWLSASNALIAAIARSNQSLTVSNGTVTYRGETQLTAADFWHAVRRPR